MAGDVGTPGAGRAGLGRLAASQDGLDRSGLLRQARAAAQQAAMLARTPEEAYRVASLRVLLEHDAGHHDQELQQARKLMKLAPHQMDSLLALQHAVECNRARRVLRAK